jgi:RND family efflux transporter MFP subunit
VIVARIWCVLTLACCACQRPDESEPSLKVKVHCVSPSLQSVDETLELRGRIDTPPGGDLPLASQVAGRIVELSVHEGQRVNAGEIAATIDDLASRGAVRQAEATLAQASAAHLNASANLTRTRALVSRGIAARQELDDATAKAETEEQAVASSQAALDLARRTLGRVQVRVAFGGVVTRVFRGPGAIVDGSAATPIAQIAATGAEFVADATERDLRRVEAGRPARVQFATGAPSLAGTVRAVSNALDPATGLGVIRVSVADGGGALMLGAQGRVLIVTKHRDKVALLPAVALRGAVADGAEVVVCTAGEASVRSVQVGYRDPERFEVTFGLAANERVAIDHVLGLETGTALVEVP